LGHDTGISSQPSAFAALTEAVPFYSGITDSDIAGRGVRWQDVSQAREKAPEVGGEAGVGSPNTQRGAPATPTETNSDSRGVASGEPMPASLTLGTYRDLWAGPITELNPPLKFLQPQQRVELSVADAGQMGLKSGDQVTVSQNGTSLQAQVAIKERVPAGVCFLAEGIADGNANALLNGAPVTVQIEKTAGRR
jgi:NADH-quinone oxidoreductase subunit G